MTIKNKVGLHARPAAVFVQAASKYKAKITLESSGKKADAKSILQVLALGVKCGHELTIRAEGPDEKEALESLAALVDSGLGEN